MEEFTISIPRERPFSVVAGLVVGGIAARHDVTLDVLDDLQLALDALLEHDDDKVGAIDIVLRVAAGEIVASVGPLDDAMAQELAEAPGKGLGLRRLLETVIDDVALSQRNGAPWVDLHKRFALAEPAQ